MDPGEMLKNLPKSPGIYMMKDFLGNIIYVGKAKNLKNRVSQYFSAQKDRSPKIVEMIRNIHTFSYVVTDTELDAFIEECRLIKEIKPRYNAQMKNDRRYSYIKIPAEKYPKVSIVTEKAEDGALFFGPFTSLSRVEDTVQYLNDFYPVRKCSSPGLARRSSGCLFRQLGTCLGACTGEVSADEYWAHIEKIRQFLNGEDEPAVQDLIKKMEEAANDLEFEKAARYRGYSAGLKHVIGKQRLVHSSNKSRNILAVEFMDEERAKLFLIKGNKLLYGEVFDRTAAGSAEFAENLKRNIREKFTAGMRVPGGLTQQDIDEAQIIYSYLVRNKKRIMVHWIPSTRLGKEPSGLDSTVMKIVRRITSMQEL